MTDIAIFWDASQLWGLLVWRAAEAFGLPYRLVKAKEIAQGALSDKTSLLLVPGGTARHKSAALGEKGLWPSFYMYALETLNCHNKRKFYIEFMAYLDSDINRHNCLVAQFMETRR